LYIIMFVCVPPSPSPVSAFGHYYPPSGRLQSKVLGAAQTSSFSPPPHKLHPPAITTPPIPGCTTVFSFGSFFLPVFPPLLLTAVFTETIRILLFSPK